jgi:hypothetical protein
MPVMQIMAQAPPNGYPILHAGKALMAYKKSSRFDGLHSVIIHQFIQVDVCTFEVSILLVHQER